MQSKTLAPLDADEKTFSHHAMKALDKLLTTTGIDGIHLWLSNDDGSLTYTLEYGPLKKTGTHLASLILESTGRTILRHCARCQDMKPLQSFITRMDNISGYGNICGQCNRLVSSAGCALPGGKRKWAKG